MGQHTRATVLTVCTGNICRSPAAQLLLEERLRGEVDVESAGTWPLVGQPVDPTMAGLLEADGIRHEGFAARRLTPALVRQTDLVLGMTRAHRSAAVQMAPVALKRSFTLREFARLAERVDPDEVRELVGSGAGVADRVRALAVVAPRHRTPASAEDDDVADPYRRGDAAFAGAHAQIVECVDILVGVLARIT